MANRPINVVIKGDYSDKDVHRAIRDLQTLQKSGPRASRALGNIGRGFAIAGAAAGAAAVVIGVEAVQAAAEDEKSAAKLAQTLDNLGLAAQSTGIEDLIEDMQFATGVSDSKLRPAFSKLVMATGDVGQATSDLGLALDIAAGTGKDVETVALALSKAYGGNAGALTRLGIPLDKAIVKSGDMKAITRELSRLFEGQAAAAADTFSGKVDILKQGVDELGESFGVGLLTGLSDAEGGLDSTAQKMRDMQGSAQTLGMIIGNVGANVLDQVEPFVLGAMRVHDAWASALAVLERFEINAQDFTGEISDEEGQRRRDALDAADAQREAAMFAAYQAMNTPAAPALASVSGQRTNTDGSVTNIYQFGDIEVESSEALTEVQKQAARLASLGGARYAGMAATGTGYRRKKKGRR